MDLLQIIFLAILQGLTEFLPISSSAHLLLPSLVMAGDKPPAMSKEATQVDHNRGNFRPDPAYEDLEYSAERQRLIYGGKKAVPGVRPMLELGREFISGGLYEPGLPMHLIVYGDIRAAGAFVAPDADGTQGLFALTSNLDVDFKITSTERFHALIQPLSAG